MKSLKELQKHPFWKDFDEELEKHPDIKQNIYYLWKIYLAGAVRYKLHILSSISREFVEDIEGERES